MFYNYLFNIITPLFSLVSIPDLMLGETKTPTPRSEEWENWGMNHRDNENAKRGNCSQ